MNGLVVSVFEPTAEEAERVLRTVPSEAAGVEIRADRLRADEVAGLVRRAALPAIVTVRAAGDGGAFDGAVEERRAILLAGLTAGAAFVDVAWNGPLAALASGPEARRVVLSHHGARADHGLRALFDAMTAVPAGRFKIVPRAETAGDQAAVRELLRHAAARGRPLAAFASGPAGVGSRALALAWGSWGTYAAARAGRPAGEGQRTAREMIEVYGALRRTQSRTHYGLVGRPVSESPTPAMHAAAFAAAGLDAVTLPLDTADTGALPALVDLFDLSGLAVTIPLKEATSRLCARHDRFAACGAVNTVRIRGGAWEGSNTDAPAALGLIRRAIDPAGATVALHGAGGTARAIGAALVAAGARVALYARDAVRAARTARAIGATAAGEPLRDARWDVLVQATPLGRTGEDVPVELSAGRVVLDCAYGAAPTPLVAAARRAGLAVFDGYDLLLAQAVLQVAVLTGRSVSTEVAAAGLASHRARSGA